MEVTKEILLPVLVAAIAANTLILALMVVVARLNRRHSVGPAATRSALQGSLMSTSYIDRSGASPWSSDGESAGAGDDAAPELDVHPEGDGEPGDGDDVEGQAASAVALTEPVAEAEPDREDAESLADDAWSDLDVTESDDEPPLELEADSEAVAASSGIDPLTGLLDQAAFTRLVAGEGLRVHRYHRSATVVIFELGGLDRLVERLGSEAADRVVAALADTMRRLARDVDHVGRLAPGRFGVLLPETDEIAAINYVERVRRACELWLESGAISLSLAVGWSGTDGDPTLAEALRLATERMYMELHRDARKATDR